MIFDIFRVDWILVDTILILILILILCSVKIYKHKNRWRALLTHNSITKINLNPKELELKDEKSYVRELNLIYNPLFCERRHQMPILLILSSKSIHNLTKAMSEGLSSYGFTIIHMLIKRRWIYFKNETQLLSSKGLNILDLVFNYIKDQYPKLNRHFLVIDFNSCVSPKKLTMCTFNLNRFIFINPSTKKLPLDWVKSSPEFYLNLIFAKKSYLGFKNRKIAKFMKSSSRSNLSHMKIDVFERANTYFKNNETILLAKLITIIQNKVN
ncbi:MAG: hypothetical protein EU517_01630 [Promethearchaeota archaeon]|nr:MAG: hypothetical protein EU517_01630 [Candidatus Lokiarchaeota archaeon]